MKKLSIFIFVIITLILAIAQNKQIIKTITTKEGFELMNQNKDNKDFIIIDVRTPDEYKEGHLINAVNINFNANNFVDLMKKLDINKKYMIYCRSGNRSGQALKIMKELGFMEVYNIGAIMSWISAGYPIVK